MLAISWLFPTPAFCVRCDFLVNLRFPSFFTRDRLPPGGFFSWVLVVGFQSGSY